MKRREFITLLGGTAVAWPLAARGQQPGKIPTIGFLGSGTHSSHGQWAAVFVQRLREVGWIEGHTIAIEYRWAEGRMERFDEIAVEFVRRKVDVIVTSGTTVVVAAKQATSVIRQPMPSTLAASARSHRHLASPHGPMVRVDAPCPAKIGASTRFSDADRDRRQAQKVE